MSRHSPRERRLHGGDGWGDAGGVIRIDRDAEELALVEDERLLDAVVYSGTSACLMG